MTTDTSEKGLETLIMRHMTGTDGFAVAPNMVAERSAPYSGTGASRQEDSVTQVSFDGERVRGLGLGGRGRKLLSDNGVLCAPVN